MSQLNTTDCVLCTPHVALTPHPARSDCRSAAAAAASALAPAVPGYGLPGCIVRPNPRPFPLIQSRATCILNTGFVLGSQLPSCDGVAHVVGHLAGGNKRDRAPRAGARTPGWGCSQLTSRAASGAAVGCSRPAGPVAVSALHGGGGGGATTCRLNNPTTCMYKTRIQQCSLQDFRTLKA